MVISDPIAYVAAKKLGPTPGPRPCDCNKSSHYPCPHHYQGKGHCSHTIRLGLRVLTVGCLGARFFGLIKSAASVSLCIHFAMVGSIPGMPMVLSPATHIPAPTALHEMHHARGILITPVFRQCRLQMPSDFLPGLCRLPGSRVLPLVPPATHFGWPDISHIII